MLQERWRFEVENDCDGELVKRVLLFDRLGTKLDEMIELARQQAEEENRGGLQDLIAAGVQEQEEEDLLQREEEEALQGPMEDHVGRGDVAEDIGLCGGDTDNIPSLRCRVAAREKEDIRPIIATLNRQQTLIFNNVQLLTPPHTHTHTHALYVQCTHVTVICMAGHALVEDEE